MSPGLPVADPRTVEAYARKLVGEGRARVLALAADPDYRGQSAVEVDGVEVRVRGCVSSLAVREALSDVGDGYAIVLTDRPVEDLGDSLVARFRRQRIEPLDAWATVPSLFRASHLDAGLRHELPWLPALLHERVPAGGYPPSATDLLTRDHVLGALAGQVLRLPADEIGLGGLLDRFDDLTVRSQWSELPDPARIALMEWVGQRAGRAAAAALELAAAPATAHVHVMALGLVFDVLYGAGAGGPGVAEARRGWENGYRLPRVEAAAAAQIGAAVRARMRLLGDTDPAARHPIWRDTPEAFAIATFPAGMALSLSHPDGYRARLGRLAQAVVEALGADDHGPAPASLEAALADLREHDLAWADQQESTERAEMAVRLVRWLAADGSGAPAMLAQALARQVAVDGWVDRATADVWSGSTSEDLAQAYRELCDRVLAVRRVHDEQFAGLLAEATTRQVLDPGVLPVERVLTDVVQPLSGLAPVLLVVVDGMSAGVAVAVADGISRLAWTEHVPVASAGARGVVLAALPTMTRYSRTSLLCGVLREGTQVDEKREFARITGGPVFHKDDLRAPAGAAVNPVVAAAIRSDQRVVGVVLNTVDDTLAKHDPDGTRWSVSAIQHLENLLELARQHGRTVVLTADHGHVVERGGRADLRELADARWRPTSTGPVGDGEVALAGPRVLAPGGSIIAPWVEDLRYGRKAAGYHGGASAAEATIPLLVFAAGEVDLAPAGWVPAGDQAPAWWHAGEAAASVKPSQVGRPRRKPAAPPRPPAGDTLFDVPEASAGNAEPAVPAVDPHAAALDGFEASPTYQRMRAGAGRAAPSEAAVRALLSRLLAGGGRAPVDQVARTLGVTPARAGMAMAGVRRLLNVEGYAVISMDADGRTVLLDEPLWRQQFAIDR